MQELPGADWKKGMEPGARLRARIIYVDAAAKRVCLSLLPHLVAGHVDSGLPPVNTFYEVCFSPVNKGKCLCVSSRGNSLVYLLLLHAGILRTNTHCRLAGKYCFWRLLSKLQSRTLQRPWQRWPRFATVPCCRMLL